MSQTVSLDENFVQWLQDTYKELHRHPELGMNLRWTTDFVRREAEKLGLKALDLPGLDVGAVFVVEGTEPGPTLALRADMDALPICEKAPVEYRSLNEGVMHACGHDLNTAVLLGVLRRVIEEDMASRMKGRLKFIFQPGEETLEGGKAMIAAGVLENPEVDRIVMSHGDPDLHVGEVAVFKDFSHANSDEFDIELKGKGGHGSRPFQTQDLLVAAAQLVNMFQSLVAREIDARDAAVLSVCSFNAGSAHNVIPGRAVMMGTVRTLRSEVQEKIIARMQEICDLTAAMFHIEVTLKYTKGVPSCPIDEETENMIRAAARKLLPAECVHESKTRMGGEDFAFYAQRKPAGVMRLGVTTPGEARKGTTHSATFEPDLKALPIGVAVLTQVIRDTMLENSVGR